jgi:hypothetical protein
MSDIPENAVARLTRLMRERMEHQGSTLAVPRPAGLLVFNERGYYGGNERVQDDYPMMSQDDWRDQLNPNEGCK